MIDGQSPLCWFIEFFKQKEQINETAAGYFYKIFHRILDNSHQSFIPILKIFQQDLLLHAYNPSICQFLQNLLQKQIQDQAKNKQKLVLGMVSRIQKELNRVEYLYNLRHHVKQIVTRANMDIPRHKQIVHFLSQLWTQPLLAVMNSLKQCDNYLSYQICLGIFLNLHNFYRLRQQKKQQQQTYCYYDDSFPGCFSAQISKVAPFSQKLTKLLQNNFDSLINISIRGRSYLNTCKQSVTCSYNILKQLAIAVQYQILTLTDQQWIKLAQKALQSPFSNITQSKIFESLAKSLRQNSCSEQIQAFLIEMIDKVNPKVRVFINHIASYIKSDNIEWQTINKKKFQQKTKLYNNYILNIDPNKKPQHSFDSKQINNSFLKFNFHRLFQMPQLKLDQNNQVYLSPKQNQEQILQGKIQQPLDINQANDQELIQEYNFDSQPQLLNQYQTKQQLDIKDDKQFNSRQYDMDVYWRNTPLEQYQDSIQPQKPVERAYDIDLFWRNDYKYSIQDIDKMLYI